jgi:hypothetical protein
MTACDDTPSNFAIAASGSVVGDIAGALAQLAG